MHACIHDGDLDGVIWVLFTLALTSLTVFAFSYWNWSDDKRIYRLCITLTPAKKLSVFLGREKFAVCFARQRCCYCFPATMYTYTVNKITSDVPSCMLYSVSKYSTKTWLARADQKVSFQRSVTLCNFSGCNFLLN